MVADDIALWRAPCWLPIHMLTVAAPALLYVRWDCTRCGHTGGMARTTIPFDLSHHEAFQRIAQDELRKKLVRVHQAKQGCIALPDDFTIWRVNPHGDRLV